MSRNDKESVQERLERMKRQKESAGAGVELVSQLSHESSGGTDFEELAQRLKERYDEKKVSKLDGTEKLTVYVDKDVAAAFRALCIERGDQRRYITAALQDFILKKARELDV